MITDKKYIIRMALFYRLDGLARERDLVPAELTRDLLEGKKIQGYTRVVQDAFARICTDFRVTEDEYCWLRREIFANWYDWVTRNFVSFCGSNHESQ